MTATAEPITVRRLSWSDGGTRLHYGWRDAQRAFCGARRLLPPGPIRNRPVCDACRLVVLTSNSAPGGW